MCYSLAGRIQTRLVALLVPALLAALLIVLSGDQRYFTMFMVMAVISLDLDLFLYPHLFSYQSRWHTYTLAVFEFMLTLIVVRWLAGTLPIYAIVWYYAAAWVGGYFLVNAILPVLDPMWVEHGGEIGRRAQPRPGPAGWTALFWRYLREIPASGLMLMALVFLAALQLTVLSDSVTVLQMALSVTGALVAWLLARRLGSPLTLPVEETLAAGLAVALLIRSPDIWPFPVAGALAAGCCLWLPVGRRPIFNGIALSLVLVLLLAPGTYSSDAQWGNSLLLPLALANIGLLISLRSRTLPLLLSFAAIAVGNAALLAMNRQESLPVLAPELIPTSLVFFAAFILADPLTAPRRPAVQIVAGAAAAAGGLALQRAGIGLPFPVALLVVNYAVAVGSQVARLIPTGVSPSDAAVPPAPAGVSRRAFLSAGVAAGGTLLLGGALRRLSVLDPAMLSLPAEPALAGGQSLPRFEDVAGRSGIVLSHHGAPKEGNPAIGTGVAWGDYDGDGRLDLYVTDHMGRCHLYRNNGDGTFTDVAESAGVVNPGLRSTSATFVDFDNDGRPDLYVGRAYGPNVLYHNNGDGTFTDVTKRSGLGDRGRTMSTAWGDYDGDGYLDVFVVNYTNQPISLDPNASPLEDVRTVTHVLRPYNRLYHNNGDGTFTDVTHLLGELETRGLGFSAVWFDYNNDGRPDLYVAYDFGGQVQPDVLWRNDGPDGKGGWNFTSVGPGLGVATEGNPMGVTSGDYNNDGWLDLAVSNIGPNHLYRNQSGRSFQDMAQRARVTHAGSVVGNMLNPSMTWGASFADFNNDGWLDLFMVAGAMDYQNVPQPNMLYLNDHTGHFVDVSAPAGINDPGQGRSVAVGDYNGDGYLDMFVANYGQPPLLYRNMSRSIGNHWLRLKLEGTRSNRDAVGARVTVHAAGLPPQMREVQIGQGLGSCNETALHFGLAGTDRAQRIEIRWPSGIRQVLHDVAAGREISVREPGKSRWSKA